MTDQQTLTEHKTEWDQLFIGSRWTQPSTSDVIEVRSPATGQYVGKVPLAAPADVDAAVAAARKAFDEGPWPTTPPSERAAVLARVVTVLENRADEFKHLLTLEAAISEPQTTEMQAQKLQLVVPKTLHETYSAQQQAWLMSLRDFIGVVQVRQP